MQIIPALDLKDTRVVHATGGDRRRYHPLGNARFPSCEPADVVRRLRSQYECTTFYIADLDAIGGNGNNTMQIHELAREFPELELWLDCGVRNQADFTRLRRTHSTAELIVASETLRDAQLPATLTTAATRFILSLDFDDGELRGDGGLLERASDWPHTVIVLSLPAVGAASGPDFTTVSAVHRICGKRRLVAGGGVRDENDLTQLQRAGADAALVANALYTGKIK